MTRTERPVPGLGPTDRVALIAGSGRLPVELAAELAAAGKAPFVIVVAGEKIETDAFAGFEQQALAPEEIGSLLPLLKRHRITHVVMAGGVSRRPALRAFKITLPLLLALPRLLYSVALGDNGVLKATVSYLEDNGIIVVGAHEILPDLLATPGPLTRRRPRAADRRDLAAAQEAALAIGRLDIGQAAVAIGGRVVALEGIEGTDQLLERVGSLRGHGRIAGIVGGALVKCAKPGQELRADLPTIGPTTVERAHAAGLAGIGVEAGRAFVLDHAHTIQRADALGLYVVGLGSGSAA